MFDVRVLKSSRPQMFIEIALFPYRTEIFPTFGSKHYPTRLCSAKNKNSQIAEQSLITGIL